MINRLLTPRIMKYPWIAGGSVWLVWLVNLAEGVGIRSIGRATVRSIIYATVHPQTAQSGGESEEGRRFTPLGRARGEGRAVACPDASARAFPARTKCC